MFFNFENWNFEIGGLEGWVFVYGDWLVFSGLPRYHVSYILTILYFYIIYVLQILKSNVISNIHNGVFRAIKDSSKENSSDLIHTTSFNVSLIYLLLSILLIF